ncbi:MAG TPA: hypothetical protein VGQ89_08440, partial [Candidatus Limnocylindrales bacterium]|nr:hypothetical protein [Candidatus Limnocylindrales bacterium]
RQGRPVTGQDPDRAEDDEEAEEGDRAAGRRATAPGPPHEVSGGANLEPLGSQDVPFSFA